MDLRKIIRLELLLVFVPISAVAHYQNASPTWVFVTTAIAIVPLAGLMGMATEQLAHRVGSTLGGLMNATFGNAAELIIALAALRNGQHEVVKASITGSIIGNILLVLGLSQLAGGLRFERQVFNRTSAAMSATLMMLSTIGLVVPAILHGLFAHSTAAHDLKIVAAEHHLSLLIATVLFASYLLSLVFTLVTHRHLFVLAPSAAPAAATEAYASPKARDDQPRWSVAFATLVLLAATAGIAWLADRQLVPTIESIALDLKISELFIGVIVVAIIGNAAEHSTAVLVAWRNQMDLSYQIAVGSGLQISLFVAPVLVFASYAIGPEPMDLHFSMFEVIAVSLSVLIVTNTAQDGESNWLEGALLLAVYGIMGIAFYYLPH